MPVQSSRAGFTAPELLNMVVVGAILAAIIYGQRPHPGPAIDPAIAPMRAALIELKQAEEGFRARTGHYTMHLDSLQVAPAAGVTREIDRADSLGWHGKVAREGTSARCELTVSIGTASTAADSVVCHPTGG